MEIKPLLVEADLYIHAYDVDVMGYVSNIVYIRWFEDMRHHMLDIVYPFEKMIEEGIAPVLMHTELDYLRPFTIHDKPIGRSQHRVSCSAAIEGAIRGAAGIH